MDYESKLLEARLHAIEAVLLHLSAQDAQTLEKIRAMLSQEHQLARTKQNSREEPNFQTAVQFEMRPARDRSGEAAKTDAYERLCKKFGAPLAE